MKHSEKQKTILITGAGGFLGDELIRQLSYREDIAVYALTSAKEKVTTRHKKTKNLLVFSLADWENQAIPLHNVDTVIHCAFSRSADGSSLAKSLEFTSDVLIQSCKAGIASFINISSEGVYGSAEGIWKESTPPVPESLYGMAKLSTEIVMKQAKRISCNKIAATSLRVSSLVGAGMDAGKKNHAVKIISTFVSNALKGKPIQVIGGKQLFSYMDVRDAADGIIALSDLDPSERKEIYNLGTEIRAGILEVAQVVKDIAEKYMETLVHIDVEKKNINMVKVMDSSEFYRETGWLPKIRHTGHRRSCFYS